MASAGATTTYSYDVRGRRTGYASPAETGAYGYDDSDHLTSFTRDVGKDGSIETSAAYAYDGNGQRTCSVVSSGSVITTTTYAYDGLTLLSASSVTGTRTTSVSYINDSAGRPVAAYVSVPDAASPVFVWLVTDQRGDVIELMDANCAPVAYYSYTPYGEPLASSSQATGSLTANVTARSALRTVTATESRLLPRAGSP